MDRGMTKRDKAKVNDAESVSDYMSSFKQPGRDSDSMRDRRSKDVRPPKPRPDRLQIER